MGLLAANKPLKAVTTTTELAEEAPKMNAADILYFVGAFVVYAAIATFLAQSWDSIGYIGRLASTVGIGGVLWATAAWLKQGKAASEQAHGIGNALLLIGSISLSVGVGVALGEFADDKTVPWLSVFGAIMIASLHFGMDMVVRSIITMFVAVAASVVAYVLLVAALFGPTISSVDFWSIIGAFAGLMMIGAGAVSSRSQPNRQKLRTLLWALGGFGTMWALITPVFASEYKIIWQTLFPLVLYAAFYASIRLHSKNFLASGAIFLFVYVIYMSFNYFGSGLGAAGALLVSGIGIIGSAALVQSIRKKYFQKAPHN
jgi:hypothetical protein